MRKKLSQTQAASDLAILAKIGPPPSFSFSSRSPLTPDSIMNEKLGVALQLWAIQKMGRDREKYIEQANRNFFALLSLAMNVAKKDLITALKETPYALPVKPRLSQPDSSNFSKLKREYEQLLPEVQGVKNKTRHNPATQRLGLAEALGITDNKKICRYLGMKASDIVLHHLRAKHKLTVDIEMIHKRLFLERHPMKELKQFITTIAKESGVRLP